MWRKKFTEYGVASAAAVGIGRLATEDRDFRI